MKRKNKIIEKIKRFLPLLLAVILSGSMILGLWLFSRSKGVNTVSASAEVEEYEDALNTYSGFNLLPFPYNDGYKQENGLTFAPQTDGRIGVFGMNSATSVFTIYFNKVNLDIFEISKSYTASMRVGGGSSSWYLQINSYTNGSWLEIARVNANVDVRFTVPSGTTGFNIFFVALARDTYIDTSLFPMITLNSYVYDWTPPIGSIYSLGYKQGYADITAETKEMYRIQAEQAVLEDKETFLESIFAIVDAPLNVIRNAFNFEILGFNVADLLFFVLTLILFVFVIKKIKGG